MRVGYFVNRYPAVSHSFIRREILALESRGHDVFRYALDTAERDLVDPADLSECARTKHLFRQSAPALARDVARTLIRHPTGLIRALVTVFEMGPRSDRGLLRHFAYLVEAAVLACWCARNEVQHLHAHFGTNSAAVAVLVRRICGLPFSFTVHGPDEFDRPEALALRIKVREAAFVVAVSSYGRGQLMRWSDVGDWSKLTVVHCGLDAEFGARQPIPAAEEKRLVCVGRLAEQKGCFVLMAALALLAKASLRFQMVFAGDGPLRPQIERGLRELGLSDRVTITGWVSGARIVSELEQAHALVLPSLAEGLPVAIMEAMALGRPVISTFTAGIPELVLPGETGWLVPAGDVQALADAIRELLDSPPARLNAMGLAAAKRVRQRHDIAREAGKLETCIIGGCDEHRDPEYALDERALAPGPDTPVGDRDSRDRVARSSGTNGSRARRPASAHRGADPSS